ncbi:MAG: DotU family type IV/VI secretion system protein [Planctomycetaceae bacterium]
MSPDFAASVDPVFRLVLDLLDRMAAGEAFDPQFVQRRILDRLEQADAAVGATRDWELARYALVSWIDEVLLDTEWSGRNWWSNNVLEAELFRTRDCSTRFYACAEEARGLVGSQALEVFYDCVVLGFRGMYRSHETAQSLSDHDGLSDSLEAWLRRTALALAKREALPAPVASLPAGAPPRTARRWAVGTLLLLLFLLVVDVLFYHLRASA